MVAKDSSIRCITLQQTVAKKGLWNFLRITGDILCRMLMRVMADWANPLRKKKSQLTLLPIWPVGRMPRRYFVDAQKTSPRAAGEVLVLIAKLYGIESETKHLSPKERFAVRQKESTPLLERIKKKLEEHLPGHLPQSPMRQAINYTLGLWKELNVYLQDGRLPIDNNLAEQAIRPIALGRKNWLFLGSENWRPYRSGTYVFCRYVP